MYEDRTYEAIMAEMMEDAPDGIDTSEGSLIWNGVSKMAYLTEQVYDDLEELNANLLPDTMDLDHLKAYGAGIGVPIEEATYAEVTATIVTTNGAPGIGDRYEATDSDYTYSVTDITGSTSEDNVTTATVVLEAEDEGTEPNAYTGDIEPVEYFSEFQSGTITEVTVLGKEEEDEEDYRYRLLAYSTVRPFSGNRAYYKEIATDIAGVEGIKAYRVTSQSYNVKLVIMATDHTAPSTELINTVQQTIDPTQDGEGIGEAPLGAVVQVAGVEPITMDVQLTLTLEDGYTANDVQPQIEDGISTYLNEVASEWADTDEALTVYKSKIEASTVDVDGVRDVTDCTWTFGGTAQSGRTYTLDIDQIPTLGGVTCG